MFKEYDVIVVGAGHAGCEAAAAAANMGSSVLLATMNMNTIAHMSCNPAMGGVAKGQILKEIDALGGYSGIVSDKSMIQFRMLNKSKGPAMWSPRTQNDRMRFAEEWRLKLEQTPNIDFWQEMVTGIIVENNKVTGIETGMGIKIKAKSVVLTNGTFLNGIIHIGEKQFGGGRSGERASKGITEQLESLGFESGRMKTGTPPRVDGRSLDYTKMEEQAGDINPEKFSFSNETSPLTEQRSCHITYTNPKVHEILESGFEFSPMFNGRIQGLGPRYCPSIEDKINRFAERDRHQIFVEPEGWKTVEIYVNGFSTSLPEEIQYKALKEIAGFENVKMFRPGYAIEYDFFPPTQLTQTLETKLVKNLFFAGQINDLKPFILGRSEAYIGVLIDDLINKGTDEPYRMFTSRAEHRILLRQDNADIRLTPLGHAIGLASEERLKAAEYKKQTIETIIKDFKNYKLKPDIVNEALKNVKSAPIKETTPVYNLLKRPEISIKELQTLETGLSDYLDKYDDSLLESSQINIKYESYIEKENQLAEKMVSLENLTISDKINFAEIPALSSEAKEKFKKIKPKTLGQASRISGVSPADVSILMVYLGR
jgi:tRNA uridine 5-carboxymethylaminomethyl modification enzyme